METRSKRLYLRDRVIFRHLSGYLNRKSLRRFACVNLRRVASNINAYKAEGDAGLVRGKNTGTPKLLTGEWEQRIYSHYH
jgi:hypothetical protein